MDRHPTFNPTCRIALPLIFMVGLGANRGDTKPRSIGEIKSDVESTIASIPALSVSYTLSFEPSDELRHRGTDAWGPRRCWWAVSGEKFGHWAEDGAPNERPVVFSFDGKKGYRTEGAAGTSRVTIMEDPRTTSPIAFYGTPAVLIGMAVPAAKGSLPEALAKTTAKLRGVEVIDGVACDCVEVPSIEALEGDIPLDLVVWLDRTREGLPRRIRTSYAVDDPALQNKPELRAALEDAHFTWQVAEFALVPNPTRKEGKTWLPKRASILQYGGRHELVVQEATIRSVADEAWFRPAAPAGTLVIDHTKGDRMGAIVGGRKLIDTKVTAIVKEAAILRESSPKSIDATPQRANRTPLYTLLASTVVLVGAGLLWWKAR